jgi:ribosomal-protein-alanine N-acetyltransferase
MKDDLRDLIYSQKQLVQSIQKKLNIEEYIFKLTSFATIIPFYTGTVLNAFIAYYSNDELKQNAFLTIIVVDKNSRGEGLGKLLLETSIKDLISKGFKNYQLEVQISNEKALELYKKYGFKIVKVSEESYFMNLDLIQYAKR